MNSFPSIRVEGGLLGPDVLDQLLAADLPGQKSIDFGIEGRRNLTDEIAAVFADARATWDVFQNRMNRLSENDLATSVTRDAWVIPLLGLLGFETSYNQRAYDVDGQSFAISHRTSAASDAPPVHIVGARQELGRIPASGRPRLAPHSLVQEFLNRTEHVWGLVTNGLTLRLLRDSTFIRRQAYIEFDLQAIIEEQRFHDFAAMYRLIHATRFPRGQSDASACLLEQYYLRSVEQGGRVRDHLRDGVEDCIKLLANGFLKHSANGDLRRSVSPESSGNNRISPEILYRQLLRLVYRFLFLLVSEDRGLISPNPIYREHYGIARLRRFLDSKAAYTEHDDIWKSLQVLWKVLADEKFAAYLDVAPLNGELFATQTLDECDLSNRDLLDAFWRIAWYQESPSATPRRVNYAALDVEELGSVYESLLEFHPAVEMRAPDQPEFDLISGSERKTTGSYYTPPQLVNELVQSALEPVIRERLEAQPEQMENAILSIRVCDPACGSGHFLLAAARRLGKEVARLRTGEDEPAPERMREAIRDVISHCIYGVDKNPLAVDLCRVALWLESHTAGKPLSFLDHRIRCGDSLVGVYDLAILKEGIPDEAFSPLEGDDKDAARSFAKRNQTERNSGKDLFAWQGEAPIVDFSAHSHEVDLIADDTAEAIRRKKQLFEKSHTDPVWQRQKDACDLWTTAFFQPLQSDRIPITSGILAEHLAGAPIDPRIMAQAMVYSKKQSFFHWPLEFPEVFAGDASATSRGKGFDIVLSNPPWEHVELKEQEFFAARDARISNAPTKAVRSKMINQLLEDNPNLHAQFVEALRAFNASRLFLSNSDRYPLTARGRINMYAVFAELSRNLVNGSGRCGIIVQTGIATDDTTKFFFQDLVRTGELASLYDFENRKNIFPAIDSRMKFCLLTCGKNNRNKPAEFVFFALDVDDLKKSEKRFTLTAGEIELLNPNTGNCPTFRSQADAELAKAIYRRVPVLWRERNNNRPEQNLWGMKFAQGLFNMASDSHHFRTSTELKADGYRLEGNVFIGDFDRYLPLYEAKMIHQFDHRWATYENAEDARNVTHDEKCLSEFVVQPRYWIREEIVKSTIPQFPVPLAMALLIQDIPSIRRILCIWIAGYFLNRGEKEKAAIALDKAVLQQLAKPLANYFVGRPADEYAPEMDHVFPLSKDDVDRILRELSEPEPVTRELLEQFSPKWFLGWRDITNATNERTLISSAVARVAVGHKFMLMFPKGGGEERLLLLCNNNSIILDYIARQKIGGTSMSYFIIRQLPVLSPSTYDFKAPFVNRNSDNDFRHWLLPRIIELVYTSNDLAPLARDCGYEGSPFLWDDDRRFEIRCELDAAFFHLYMPSEPTGEWRIVESETNDQLATLRRHFPAPRHAVAYVYDQFRIMREKDEKYYSRFRTKERVLEIYDAMLESQQNAMPYQTSLNPPPGERSNDNNGNNRKI